MIDIDGAAGEGGGQILRSSLALAAITGKSFRLHNIRARRSKPGLQPQHLMCVRAARDICGASTAGDSLQSTELTFEPGPIQPGKYHFRIGTAGATSLVLHTVYLPLAFARGPSEVVIEGGTHVLASPSYHFLETTWLGYMHQVGLDIKLDMERPGFYPRGGGLIRAHIQPAAAIAPLRLDQLTWEGKAGILSAVAGLPEHIAHRQADRTEKGLRRLGHKSRTREVTWQGGPGSFLAVTLPTEPVPTLFFGLGARGKKAERVADEAIEQVEAFLDAEPLGLDEHSADQVILPLALAPSASRFRVAQISSHLTTNIDVIRQFLDRDLQASTATDGSHWVEIA